MTKVEIYSQIRELKSKGFSDRKTARMLGISRGTVRKYMNMGIEEFYEYHKASKQRKSRVGKYQALIMEWLYAYPDMTAAQVYDWLLEYYGEKIDVSERTVSRFVKKMREQYNFKARLEDRQYHAIPDRPMGYQMQMDFGRAAMRWKGHKGYKSVCFVVFILAHSRYKWGYFLSQEFTTKKLIEVMDICFAHLGGIPHEIVIDQDDIVMQKRRDNGVIFTYEFQKYKEARNLHFRVCKQADPESKGMVENAVKFIKNNFLQNRMFEDEQTLNDSFFKWLERTGNGKLHGTTRRIPKEDFELEKNYLRPFDFSQVWAPIEVVERTVKKDNTFQLHCNRYVLPIGTYSAYKKIMVEVNGDEVIVRESESKTIISQYAYCHYRGRLIQPKSNMYERKLSCTSRE